MPNEMVPEQLIHLGKTAEWVVNAPAVDHVFDSQFYVMRVYVGYTEGPEVAGYFYEEDAGLWMFRFVDKIEQ